MKKLFWVVLLFAVSVAGAQTRVEKSIPVRAGQKLVLHFDYPEIKIQTWDKSEVLIQGTVSINRGENDSSFELQITNDPQEVAVTSVIKDKDKLPQHIVIKKGDTEYTFKANSFNDPEVQKFLEENNHEYTYMSSGIIKEIKLNVFVPKKLETRIDAKYGLVEVKGFDAPLTIDAKYGGIDATITASSAGDVTARTRYGEILTNLDIKFDQTRSPDKHEKWTEITARVGSGQKYFFESKYGKVYLRKPQ